MSGFLTAVVAYARSMGSGRVQLAVPGDNEGEDQLTAPGATKARQGATRKELNAGGHDLNPEQMASK